MKTIRRKVIFAKHNHVQTSCMKFTVLIIYVPITSVQYSNNMQSSVVEKN